MLTITFERIIYMKINIYCRENNYFSSWKKIFFFMKIIRWSVAIRG